MIARFHTICHRCRRAIKPGQLIVIPKVGRAVHAGCLPDPPQSHQADPELQAKLDRYEAAGFR